MRNRRLTKLFAESPAIAPKPCAKPSAIHAAGSKRRPGHGSIASMPPASVPTTTPATKPMTLLCSPSQRRLMGRFHPGQKRTNGGAMLAQYAGTTRQMSSSSRMGGPMFAILAPDAAAAAESEGDHEARHPADGPVRADDALGVLRRAHER